MLGALVSAELAHRARLRKLGVRASLMSDAAASADGGRGPPCFKCARICHMSFVQVVQHPHPPYTQPSPDALRDIWLSGG